MQPAFRRGWEGEGEAESMPWRGPAGTARHSGASTSASGNERAKPWCSRSTRTGAGKRPTPRRGTNDGTLARRDADARPASGKPRHKAVSHAARPVAGTLARRLRERGKERGKSACGSAQRLRALRSAKRGKERVPAGSRSSPRVPDRHPKGRDYRPGPRQRIERAAEGNALTFGHWFMTPAILRRNVDRPPAINRPLVTPASSS